MVEQTEVCEKKPTKDQEVLATLFKSIEKRDGKGSIELIQKNVKKKVFDSMNRETICQILSLEKSTSRLKFLMLYPEYIFPYLFRSKNKQEQ